MLSRRILSSSACLLLAMLASQAGAQRRTAAMIVGGFENRGGINSPPLDHVELYGCSSNEDYNIALSPFPRPLALTSGTVYVNPDDGVATVLVCGGVQCPPADGGIDCGSSADCWIWDRQADTWSPHSTMNRERAMDLLLMAPNAADPSDDVYYPLVVGGDTATTELFIDGAWQDYNDLPSDDWSSLGCLNHNQDILFRIGDNLTLINLNDWEVLDFDVVPDALEFPLTCSLMINPDDPAGARLGIYTRYGYYLSLFDTTWSVKSPPPLSYLSARQPPNSIFRYRLNPTIFGFPVCDETGFCRYTDVQQYQPMEDEWVSLGPLLEERTFHTVIEIPGEFCDAFSPYKVDEGNTAALVIGGFFGNSLSAATILNSTELIGCPQAARPPVADFPTGIGLTAGMYIRDDNTEVGRVLVCGGYAAVVGEEDPSATDACWSYDPVTNAWTEDGPLTGPRWQHIMVSAPDLNNGGNADVPVVLGGPPDEAEIYDPVNNIWTTYITLPDSNGWISSSCLSAGPDDKVYHINTAEEILELDLTSDSFATGAVGAAPPTFTNVFMCPIVEIDGVPGIFVRYGYFYNLQTGEWETKAPPPLTFLSTNSQPNGMVSWRGRPTYFGFPDCGGDGECTNSDIVQYDPDENRWDVIGVLQQERRSHLVVEVPGEFCPYLFM